MKHLLIVLLIHGSLISQGQNLATADILQNVFLISTDTGTATSFVINYSGREYLITARHAFKKKNSDNSLVDFKIYHLNNWMKLKGKLLLDKDTSIDISVIMLDEQLQVIKPLEVTKSYSVGQECYFFGFPYGKFFTSYGTTVLPFVKRAMVSAIGGKIVFLDGINNLGFSGGPVVVKDPNDNKLKICCVITAYYPEYNSVEKRAGFKVDSLRYYGNSGIIFSYPLSYLDEILTRQR
jgi:hypothetical protein